MACNRKLLILDLDETLVHARLSPLERPADFQAGLYYVYKRPHLEQFLSYALDHFDVSVWTSAGAEYAECVVAQIMPDPAALQFVWSAERCGRCYDPETQERQATKPLTKVRRRFRRWSVSQILAIDDTPSKWQGAYGNYIRISEWTGDTRDDELLALITYLDTLRELTDMRCIEKRGWRARINKAPAF